MFLPSKTYTNRKALRAYAPLSPSWLVPSFKEAGVMKTVFELILKRGARGTTRALYGPQGPLKALRGSKGTL